MSKINNDFTELSNKLYDIITPFIKEKQLPVLQIAIDNTCIKFEYWSMGDDDIIKTNIFVYQKPAMFNKN